MTDAHHQIVFLLTRLLGSETLYGIVVEVILLYSIGQHGKQGRPHLIVGDSTTILTGGFIFYLAINFTTAPLTLSV